MKKKNIWKAAAGAANVYDEGFFGMSVILSYLSVQRLFLHWIGLGWIGLREFELSNNSNSSQDQ